MSNNADVTQVSVKEITRAFPVYLQRIEAGETFIIVQAGKPLAQLGKTTDSPCT